MGFLRQGRMKTTSIITNSVLLFLFGMIACLSSCQTVNGKKYYVGPKIRFDLNVKGVGIGVTLYDPLNPEDPRIIEINPPQPPAGGKEPVPTP